MISIVIPILNEAETIAKLIQHLLDNSTADHVAEIIIVDGGSTDDSQEIINTLIAHHQASELHHSIQRESDATKLLLINSEKGRAKQMNAGAKIAKGEILYFLHADSFPPKDFDQDILTEVEKGNNAGCFRMQFDSNHWWLQLAGWLTQFCWRACRGGDQSQFITKKLFDEIGGFDERYVIYEDNMLINELFARKQFVVINRKLTTSARLYHKHGIWKVQYHFWTIYLKKWLGATPNKLLTYYKKHLS
ncbi:TIGR04283 family arsenosugar biosynthesis glycosyltransferase [Gelidibacter sp. F63206]|uniref:TIGR04283 family arsenosugar biosynthesis glycosyltransferase n=1 Tax=Gelidibacter sp. F63206 TaxID=2926425 RepID=UPI001FF697E7|nr:TIGR04283 family arsenosugar biosynthesis glycosyltransferase [Gelidibacter sp. F63206]MCK0114614.1 TIGR04283 family arsenosugar biosynthesis glycosyltransferase [Gelidibacter sp. F63206]